MRAIQSIWTMGVGPSATATTTTQRTGHLSVQRQTDLSGSAKLNGFTVHAEFSTSPKRVGQVAFGANWVSDWLLATAPVAGSASASRTRVAPVKVSFLVTPQAELFFVLPCLLGLIKERKFTISSERRHDGDRKSVVNSPSYTKERFGPS